MTTQLERLYVHERERPRAVWLTQPMGEDALEEIDHARAMDEARRMAAHLRQLALPPGSHIVIFAKNNAWWFLADIAIWMAGHVSVPLYPTLARDTIAQIIAHSDAVLAFIGKLDGFGAMAPGIPPALPRITLPLAPKHASLVDAPKWADIVASTAPMRDSPIRESDEIATLIYTSGTTGTPKGVMHSFRSMCSAQGYIDELGMRTDDRMLSYLPLAHSLERTLVETTSMLLGFHVFFAESVQRFVDDLRRARPTLFVSVPRLWHKLQAGVFSKIPARRLDLLLRAPIVRRIVRRKILDGLGLGAVRFAGSGSAPIPADLIAWYRRLGLELLEGYGMTENSSYSHMTRPGAVRVGYVGQPQPGVSHRIGAGGEILVKSPGNMLGYYKNPELTAETIDADGYVHTGDLGTIDDRDRLAITGRVKELFKTSKGKYVAPTPIESELLRDDKLDMVVVTGGNKPQPFALAVLAEHARELGGARRHAVETALLEDLDRVNARLDPHERLVKLVVVSEPWTIENGLLTPSLKVRRTAVEARYAPHVEAWYADRARVQWFDG
jgi:long-chain acyl-CoA synthetase